MEASLAYFVLAHRGPDHLRLLVETIADPRDLVILHVDLKSMLGLRPERSGTWTMARRLARERPNVILMRPRCTNWGGWSLSQVLLDAIDLALARAGNWTHLVNLSGQCFPIKPLDAIRAQLGESRDTAYVQLRHFSSLPPDDWHLRWQPMIELPHKALALRGPRRRPDRFELEYKGSQWCILPRAFCEWQRRAPIARDVRQYLRGAFLSDELLMQTLVRNSPWRGETAAHYGREIIWPGPRVMTMADWDLLQQSPAFYARKFDTAVDDRIAPALARAIASPASLPSIERARTDPSPHVEQAA
ncbi:MAG TPA: beta-1,6-N-acetylglucosaminyltransferase [Acetobacteraceae bacterium]|nr:beta-1,6-N-acetylglucosaminyltransferase [Acetobacteraceae bacterium]